MILSGAGVGGGSLNYANTLYEPLPPVLRRPAVGPHHRLARRAGAVLRPGQAHARRRARTRTITPSDEVMRAVAEEMGVGDTFRPTPGRRVLRRARRRGRRPVLRRRRARAGAGCIQCGECMTGCRHGAKNTLLQNYLYLAERAGAEVHPLTTVTAHPPAARRPLRRSTPSAPGAWVRKRRRTFVGRRRRARGRARWARSSCCTACATRATSRTCRRGSASSPARTPRPSSAPARSARDVDFTRGVAITSSFHPDDHTHIEPVRYGKGSNAMGLLTTALADGGGRSRPLTLAAARSPATR